MEFSYSFGGSFAGLVLVLGVGGLGDYVLRAGAGVFRVSAVHVSAGLMHSTWVRGLDGLRATHVLCMSPL